MEMFRPELTVHRDDHIWLNFSPSHGGKGPPVQRKGAMGEHLIAKPFLYLDQSGAGGAA